MQWSDKSHQPRTRPRSHVIRIVPVTSDTTHHAPNNPGITTMKLEDTAAMHEDSALCDLPQCLGATHDVRFVLDVKYKHDAVWVRVQGAMGTVRNRSESEYLLWPVRESIDRRDKPMDRYSAACGRARRRVGGPWHGTHTHNTGVTTYRDGMLRITLSLNGNPVGQHENNVQVLKIRLSSRDEEAPMSRYVLRIQWVPQLSSNYEHIMQARLAALQSQTEFQISIDLLSSIIRHGFVDDKFRSDNGHLQLSDPGHSDSMIHIQDTDSPLKTRCHTLTARNR